MPKKIKLNEVASDLNVSPQDLISFFAERGDTKKKSVSSLTADEINLLLEHYTVANQVSDFNEYFASANDEKPVPEPVKEKPK